jgi:sulfur-carrier protein
LLNSSLILRSLAEQGVSKDEASLRLPPVSVLAIEKAAEWRQALGPKEPAPGNQAMPRVTFTANLQRHLDVPSLEVEGARVGEVLAGVFSRKPLLRSYIVDDQGRLRRHVNVFVNTAMIADRDGLSDPVKADDEVFVFQALSGG